MVSSASRLLVWALLAAAAAGVAESAQARKRLLPSPDHPGKCYDPDQKLVLAPGSSQPARGACQENSCVKTDTGFELVVSSCGSVGVSNGCRLDTPNRNAPYPQCCPTVKCG